MTPFQNRWIEIAPRFQLTVRTDVHVALDVDEAINDASIIEMLRDWSWSSPGTPPAWYAA